MPANLTPQYREAEKRYREATVTEDKIEHLEEMIRLLPKHKGTDHLYADLKRRLSKLRSGKGQKRGASRQKSPYHIPSSGAGQIVMIGLPNAGKSAILVSLTNKSVEVAPYPFTTHLPVPAMMPFQNAQVELIDTPPVTAEHCDPELVALIKRARLCVFVLNLADDDVLEAVDLLNSHLTERNVKPVHHLSAIPEEEVGVNHVHTLVVGTHIDVAPAEDHLVMLQELVGDRFAVAAASPETGQNMEELRQQLWHALHIIRVYSQPHGKKADLNSPFYLDRGATVLDFAAKLHRDFAENLKSVRVWGSAQYDGQHVKANHVLEDGDVVELSA